MEVYQVIISIFTAVMASSGLWAFLDNRAKKNDLTGKLIHGMAYDRIMYLCNSYIKHGYISKDEYENLINNLYQPYIDMGGNGVIKRLMSEVDKLPIKKRED